MQKFAFIVFNIIAYAAVSSANTCADLQSFYEDNSCCAQPADTKLSKCNKMKTFPQEPVSRKFAASLERMRSTSKDEGYEIISSLDDSIFSFEIKEDGADAGTTIVQIKRGVDSNGEELPIVWRSQNIESYKPSSVSACKYNDRVFVAAVSSSGTNNNLRLYEPSKGNEPIATHTDANAHFDSVAFTRHCTDLVVADEGENQATLAVSSVHPEMYGKLNIFEVQHGPSSTSLVPYTVKFGDAFTDAENLGRTGHGFAPSKDWHPEYVVTSKMNNNFAYVTLQENSAVASLDIQKCKLVSANSAANKTNWKECLKVFWIPDEELTYPFKASKEVAARPYPKAYVASGPDGASVFQLVADDKVTYEVLAISEEDAKAATENQGCSSGKLLDDDECFDAAVLTASMVTQMKTDNVLDSTVDYQPLVDAKSLILQRPNTYSNGTYTKLVLGGGRGMILMIMRVVSVPSGKTADYSVGSIVFDTKGELTNVLYEQSAYNFASTSKYGPGYAAGRLGEKSIEPASTCSFKLNQGRNVVAVGLERASIIAVYDVTELKNPGLVALMPPPLTADGEELYIKKTEGLACQDYTDSVGYASLMVGGEKSATLAEFHVKNIDFWK